MVDSTETEQTGQSSGACSPLHLTLVGRNMDINEDRICRRAGQTLDCMVK